MEHRYTGQSPYRVPLAITRESYIDPTPMVRGVSAAHRFENAGATEAAVTAEVDPWKREAKCANSGVDFFPKLVCVGCPVRTECLDYALENGEKFGVWGGYSERERRPMRSKRKARRNVA